MSQTLIICETCRNPQCYCTCKPAPSACTVDSIVGFPIPTSYEEYLMLTDEQKFRLYEITKKPNHLAQAPPTPARKSYE